MGNPAEDPVEFPEHEYADLFPDLLPEFRLKWKFIRTHTNLDRPIVDTIVRRFHACTENAIIHHLSKALYQLIHQSQVNFSFSFIIENKESGERKLHYASQNAYFLDKFIWLRSFQEIEALLEKLKSKNIVETLHESMPSSKWRIIVILGLTVFAWKSKERML